MRASQIRMSGPAVISVLPSGEYSADLASGCRRDSEPSRSSTPGGSALSAGTCPSAPQTPAGQTHNHSAARHNPVVLMGPPHKSGIGREAIIIKTSYGITWLLAAKEDASNGPVR